MENSLAFSHKKFNIELPYDHAIPLVGRYPQQLETGIEANTCEGSGIHNSSTGKQPKYPPLNE